MSRIRSRDTKPEMIVRRLVFAMGYRYRLHDKTLPGQPDLVFRRRKKIIFVHGCFWHLHKNCRDGTIPKTNHRRWKAKLEGNVERDRINIRDLRKNGWKVLTLYECEVEKKTERCVRRIAKFLET